MEEDEDFPKTIIMGDPIKNSKIKIQWADDSFRVGPGLKTQSKTNSSLLAIEKTSSLKNLNESCSQVCPLKNTSKLSTKECGISTKDSTRYGTKELTKESNKLQSQNSESGKTMMESLCEGKELRPINHAVELKDSHKDNDMEKKYCNSKKEISHDIKVNASSLNRVEMTSIPTTKSNSSCLPLNGVNKVNDEMEKKKSWVSILKKPNGSPSNTANPLPCDSSSPPVAEKEKEKLMQTVSLDPKFDLSSLVILASKNQNAENQPQITMQQNEKEETHGKSVAGDSGSTEKKFSDGGKIYSVSLLNMLNQPPLSKGPSRENILLQRNGSLEKDTKNQSKSTKPTTLISLLNGKTFSSPVPFDGKIREPNRISSCEKTSAEDDNRKIMKRRAINKELDVFVSSKRKKSVKDDIESQFIESFIRSTLDAYNKAHRMSSGKYNLDRSINMEGSKSDYYTSECGNSVNYNIQTSRSIEMPADFVVKQEVLDPAYGDVHSVLSQNSDNNLSENIPEESIKEEICDPEYGDVPIVSISNRKEVKTHKSSNGDDWEESTANAENENLNCMKLSLKNEVSEPEYGDTFANGNKENEKSEVVPVAPMIKQEVFDPEYEDLPPILSPKKEVTHSDHNESDEENPETPPLLHKECYSSTDEESCTQLISKKFTKVKESKQEDHRIDELNCPICDATFQRAEDFNVHKALHSGKEIISASQSRDKFIIKPATVPWDNHRRKFKCDFCGKSFNRPSNLKEHIRIHTGMYPHKCQFCGKGFHTRRRFLTHMVRHDEEKESLGIPDGERRDISIGQIAEIQENSNDGETRSNGPMLLHTKKEDTDVLFQKVVANMSLESEKVSLASTPYRKYICSICGENFEQVTKYRIHKMEHRGESPHVCKTCNKLFSCKSDLVRHEATHSDERPHLCKVCGKAFKRPNALNDHMTLHGYEREKPLFVHNSTVEGMINKLQPDFVTPIKNITEPDVSDENSKGNEQVLFTDDGQRMINSKFYCKECKISFSARREYSMHRFQHNGGQPHTCAICSKIFAFKSDYDRHLGVHTGRKPYVCHLCDSEFSRKCYLQKHLEKHKNTHISVKGKSKILVHEDKFEIEIDNPEKSYSDMSDSEQESFSTTGKLETSYDENGAMFLVVTDC